MHGTDVFNDICTYIIRKKRSGLPRLVENLDEYISEALPSGIKISNLTKLNKPLDKILSIHIELGKTGSPVLYSILNYWGVPVLCAHAQGTGWNVTIHSSSKDSKLISQTEMNALVEKTTNDCLMVTWMQNEHYPTAQIVDFQCERADLSGRRQLFQAKDNYNTIEHLKSEISFTGTTSKCLLCILVFRLHIVRTNLNSIGKSRDLFTRDGQRISKGPRVTTPSSKPSNDLPFFASMPPRPSESSNVSLNNIQTTPKHRPDISEVSGDEESGEAEHITISVLPDASAEDIHGNATARTLLCNIFGNQIELEDFLTLPRGAKRKLSLEFKLGHKKARFDYDL